MILVTGATGNVGEHLVAQLLEQGQSVRALTRHPEKAQLPAAHEAGLRRVVFLSSGAVVDGVERQADLIAEMHAEIERAIEASGLAWTRNQPHGFTKRPMTQVRRASPLAPRPSRQSRPCRPVGRRCPFHLAAAVACEARWPEATS